MVKKGDIIWLNFDPHVGHEQGGRRPALVVSCSKLHYFSNMVMVCPITNTNRAFPLHVPLDRRTKTTGVVLCDHARMCDIDARNYAYIESAPKDIVAVVVDIICGFTEHYYTKD